jgi:hypothetical protein
LFDLSVWRFDVQKVHDQCPINFRSISDQFPINFRSISDHCPDQTDVFCFCFLFNALTHQLIGDLEDIGSGPVVSDILSDPVGDASHGSDLQLIETFSDLKHKCLEALEDYNIEPGLIPMNLVLFKDALSHMMRIGRVLRTMRGNALLIGVGGSGRASQTRLASFICDMNVFGIEITKNYRVSSCDSLKW